MAVFRNEDFHRGVTLVPEHAEKVHSRLGKLPSIKIVLLARTGGPARLREEGRFKRR